MHDVPDKEHVRNQRKNMKKKRKKQLFSKSNHNTKYDVDFFLDLYCSCSNLSSFLSLSTLQMDCVQQNYQST